MSIGPYLLFPQFLSLDLFGVTLQCPSDCTFAFGKFVAIVLTADRCCRSPDRYRVDQEFHPASLVLCYDYTISSEVDIVNAKCYLFVNLFDNLQLLSELSIQYTCIIYIFHHFSVYCLNSLSEHSVIRLHPPQVILVTLEKYM